MRATSNYRGRNKGTSKIKLVLCIEPVANYAFFNYVTFHLAFFFLFSRILAGRVKNQLQQMHGSAKREGGESDQIFDEEPCLGLRPFVRQVRPDRRVQKVPGEVRQGTEGSFRQKLIR